MANTMTGRVLLIGNTEEIPSKNGGEPFKKRVVVLNCTHSDFGQVYENYPSFEFSGKHVDDPAGFAVGEIVTISFALQGTKYQKSANDPVKYFNTISGYKIEKVSERWPDAAASTSTATRSSAAGTADGQR